MLQTKLAGVLALALGMSIWAGCARDEGAGTAERDRTEANERLDQDRYGAGQGARGREGFAGAMDQAGEMGSDAALTAKVKAKLAADAKLSSLTEINVDSRNGVVTLQGGVPSQEYKTMVERLAREVEGVTRVENKLRVESAKGANR